MIRFLENIGDYFSQHFFNEDFPKKVFDKAGYVTQKKDDEGQSIENHVSTLNSKIAPLREKYFRFKNDYLGIQRIKDRVRLTHDFHNELLRVLDYKNGIQEYESPVYLNEKEEVIPVRYQYHKGSKPYLFIMEMKAMIKEGDEDPEGIYEQVYLKDEWQKVFPESWEDIQIKPDVINEALTELFILSEDERPEYLIMLAAPKVFLIHYEKWKYDSFLLFDLEELFTESQVPANRDYLALFYTLLSKPQFISETDSILKVLEEDAHKAMYGVTQALKNSVVFAVESLANEAIYYKLKHAENQQAKKQIEELMASDTFARELKDECLTFVYRLLFLFYAESREDLEILPVKDSVYQKGYSLEMLRDLEMVPLTTDSSRNGHFFSESLWKLFNYLHKGQENENGFTMKPLDSPLFDNATLIHLKEIQFRNHILQQIILRLSLSEKTRKKGRGRISYANLGINQLGSVYESLLAFSGFFASETLIEVKAADDKDGKEGTFLVPKGRRDDFEEDEILKDPEFPERDFEIEKGSFVYRLNGRDRKKTASYYTPEVLTQTTVKYTLKGILDKLKERQEKGEECADEILQLKILEPAMGAAAFQNEVINQLAVAYLDLKEKEVLKSGGKRIIPGGYIDEIQKVKAHIASHNVYGVDLNPTAIELGKLSLWLNCMHKNMETPFFAYRLGVGNAVVGAWLRVYNSKDFIVEYPTVGTPNQRRTPIPKDWWNKPSHRIEWKNGKLNRKDDQLYHFLLPDERMAPYGSNRKLKEELSEVELKAFNTWKREFKAPISGEEFIKLKRICDVIDVLFEENYQQTARISQQTISHYNLFGQQEPSLDFKTYREKEKLVRHRNDRSTPYFKIKTIMDYWCSFWFWDLKNVKDLPSREQWYNEVETILGLDITKLSDIEKRKREENGLENGNALQTNLFGGTQLSIGGIKLRTYDKNQLIKQLIAEHTTDYSSLFRQDRIEYIQHLSDKYRFFHNELEFIEVFIQKGGFDIIVGNPPWVGIEFNYSDILSEVSPEIIIRDYSDEKIQEIFQDNLKDGNFKASSTSELIDVTCLQAFMSLKGLYEYVEGRNNLYRNILNNSLLLINKLGMVGLLHPEKIFAENLTQSTRSFFYNRLKYHFQFQNEKKLFAEVGNAQTYSINIYANEEGIDIKCLFSLFHPSTIVESFQHLGNNPETGIKIKDSAGKFVWNTQPHKNRIINYDLPTLELIGDIIYNDKNYKNTKLVQLFSKTIISILKRIKYSQKINPKEYKFSTGFNEAIAPREGIITRSTDFHSIQEGNFVLSGPIFYVSNPFYQTPKKICNSHRAYEVIDYSLADEDFIPRTNYMILEENRNKIDSSWVGQLKLVFPKMQNNPGERTLQSSLMPSGTSHIDSVVSLIFKNKVDTILFCGLASSLLYDSFTKIIGKKNFREDVINTLPFPKDFILSDYILQRTLLLNCVNKYFSPIWEENYQEIFKQLLWSKTDPRLKVFNTLSKKWSRDTFLMNWYERRYALIEIDVIVSIALGIELNELISIYNLLFPVLQQNEDDTWYDQKGNIIFTCSKGLNGIGIDRNEWEAITKPVNSMQRTLLVGESYDYTITKSELYYGKNVTYYAPFDKCDRVEDYITTWKHFEKIIAEKIVG